MARRDCGSIHQSKVSHHGVPNGDYHHSREAIAKGHEGIFNSIYKDGRASYGLCLGPGPPKKS